MRKSAKALDDAIESGNAAELVSCFYNNCEIQLTDINLTGLEGMHPF